MKQTNAVALRTYSKTTKLKDEGWAWALCDGDIVVFEVEYLFEGEDVCNWFLIIIGFQRKIFEHSHFIACEAATIGKYFKFILIDEWSNITPQVKVIKHTITGAWI